MRGAGKSLHTQTATKYRHMVGHLVQVTSAAVSLVPIRLRHGRQTLSKRYCKLQEQDQLKNRELLEVVRFDCNAVSCGCQISGLLEIELEIDLFSCNKLSE